MPTSEPTAPTPAAARKATGTARPDECAAERRGATPSGPPVTGVTVRGSPRGAAHERAAHREPGPAVQSVQPTPRPGRVGALTGSRSP